MKKNKTEKRWFIFFCIISITGVVTFAYEIVNGYHTNYLIRTIVATTLWDYYYLICHIMYN